MVQKKYERPPGGQELSSGPLGYCLHGKIPVTSRANNVFHTTRLGERLIQPKSDFDLSDPNGYMLSSEYHILHDPNLRGYLYRKDIHQRLIAGGFITKDKKVICSLKEMNRYRDHLLDVEKDWAQKLRSEQKELVRQILTLQEHGKVLSDVTVSDITNWLSQSGRTFLRKTWGESCSLTKFPNITKRDKDVESSSNATHRPEQVWINKGFQSLHEITREVWREMKLERRWCIKQQEQQIKRQERQQKLLRQGGRRMEKPFGFKMECAGGDGNKTSELFAYLTDKQGSLLPPVEASGQFMHNTEKVLPEHDDLVVTLTQKSGSPVTLHSMYNSESATAQTGSIQCVTQQLFNMAPRLEADEDESTMFRNVTSLEKTQNAIQTKMSRKKKLKCLSNMTKSIMNSLPLDELFQEPAITGKEVKQEIKDQTNGSQKITSMCNEFEVPKVDENELQIFRLADRPVSMRTTRGICRPSDPAHQVIRNEAALKIRHTPSPPSSPISNTSLTASEITDEIMCKLYMGHFND